MGDGMHSHGNTGPALQPSPPFSLRAAIAGAVAYPGALRKVVRNLIEAWPAEVYHEGLVDGRFLGRRTVYVCDPALIRSLLVDQADALLREDFMIRSLQPVLGTGILTSDGAAWRAQRRTVAPVFRHDRIRDFVPAMTAAAEATRRRWSLRDGEDLDLLDEMMGTTLDIIVSTMIPNEPSLDVARFGRAVGEYLDRTGWKIALTMLGVPHWTPHPGCLRAQAAARYLRGTIAGTIANRRASGRNEGDLLGLMLEARDPEGRAAMADDALIDNLLTFVAAGHETTALVMAWTFRLLAEHPEVEARVLSEIAAVQAAGGHAAIDAYAYTRQVIMEVMRLYPPAPLIVRRTLSEVRLGNLVVPAGRSIHIPVYALHRHSALWSEPERFDPERFAQEAIPERDRYGFLPFGAGPRICIGMGFAMTECVAILTTLLPGFRFERGGSARPDARFKITLRPHGGMPMTVQRRTVH